MHFISIAILSISLFSSCSTSKSEKTKETIVQQDLSKYSIAYFASGCFWCVEAVYESVAGVPEVISGYAGGHTTDPTYRKVGSGATGHAEAIEVYYDPEIVSYQTLVDVYYASQNPTTVGQSPDFGSAYRSIIFFQNESEKQIAQKSKNEIARKYKEPVVTEIMAFTTFYKAEEYHQNYERLNPNQPYVKRVSVPRLKRFQAQMPNILKKDH